MPVPDLVIFDLGRVLVDVDFERFVQRIATTPAAQERARRIPTMAAKADCDRGRLSPAAFAAAACATHELDVTTDAFLEAWADIFTPFDAAALAIATLSRDTPLWMLSDTDPCHIAQIRQQVPWWGAFERTMLSYERGCLKSDPYAFAFVRPLITEGRHVAFVDDLPGHVDAARAAGCDAVWFQGWDGPLPDWLRNAAR